MAANLSGIANSILGDTPFTETATGSGQRLRDLADDSDWSPSCLRDIGTDDSAGRESAARDDAAGPGETASAVRVTGRDAAPQAISGDGDAGISYRIDFSASQAGFGGDLGLRVSQPTGAVEPTPLDALRGTKFLNDDHTMLVYFAVAGDEYRQGLDVYTAVGTNAYEQGQLFEIFENIEKFADIDFEITTDRNAADLEIGTAELPSSPAGTLLGFFNFPTAGGEGRFGVLNSEFDGWTDTPGGSLDTGGFMYGVAIHEFGHGMGLGHPHDTGNGSEVMSGVSSSSDKGDFKLNQAVYTAMSYVEGSHIAGVAASDASTGHGATYGALDIAVLQEFYGANTTHAAGNDTYTLADTNAAGSGAGYYAMWDTGGSDTFEYVGAKDATMDLREATLQYEKGGGGFISYVDGVIGGFTIANGTVIENATTGTGDDKLIGNDANNTLSSGGGTDILLGRAGNDTLIAGTDADRVLGGSGSDDLRGGGGDDTIKGGGGNDILFGGAEDDDLSGGRGNDTFKFSTGADTVTDYDATGNQERIDLSGSSEIVSMSDLLDNHMSQSGLDVLIDDLAGNTMTLLNTNLSDLDSFEFLFV